MPERRRTGDLPPRDKTGMATAWTVANRKALRAPQKAAQPKRADRRAGKAEREPPIQANSNMKGLTLELSGSSNRGAIGLSA
jgi:hypothetical protein